MAHQIPATGAAVGPLAAGGIIALAFRGLTVTQRASARRCQVYRAPGDFTNSTKA
jgi:hypothetical protein